MSIWSVTSCTSVNRGRMHYDFPELHDLWLAQENPPERRDNALGERHPSSERTDNEFTSNITDDQYVGAA